MKKKTIKIAGAGLAGMTAAINLAKKGYEVIVYEKNQEVGDRFFGDFQFLENWTQPKNTNAIDFLREISIKDSFFYNPSYQGFVYDNNLRKYRISAKKPLSFLVRRGSYDDCIDIDIKKQALNAGVSFEFGKSKSENEVDIIATGPSQPLIFVKGVSFNTNIKNDIRVIFDNKIAPGVYAYMVIQDNLGIICAPFIKEFIAKNKKNHFLDKAIEAFQTTGKFDITNRKYFTNFGISTLKSGGNKIYIGEAAGFQDHMWGFGMMYAFYSGFLASKAIAENLNYWDLVKEKIVPSVKSSIVNRFIFERFGNIILKKASPKTYATGNIQKTLHKLYTPTITKKLFFSLINKSYMKRF